MRYSYIFALLATSIIASASPTQVYNRVNCDVFRCAAALGPGVVSCVGAAFQGGTNLISDGFCIAIGINNVANIPPKCQECLEELDIPAKLKTIKDNMKNATKAAVEEVVETAEEVKQTAHVVKEAAKNATKAAVHEIAEEAEEVKDAVITKAHKVEVAGHVIKNATSSAFKSIGHAIGDIF